MDAMAIETTCTISVVEIYAPYKCSNIMQQTTTNWTPIQQTRHLQK